MVFQRSEQERLAVALADKDISSQEIHRLMRWWGFRGFTLGMESFLTGLVELESSFIELGLMFPNLESIVKKFTCARKLKTNLENALFKRRSEAPDHLDAIEKAAYQYREFDTRDSTGLSKSIYATRSNVEKSDVPNVSSKWLPTNGALRLAYCSALAMKLVWRDYPSDLQPKGMKALVVEILLHPATYKMIADPVFETQMAEHVKSYVPSGFDTLPQFIEEFVNRINTHASIERNTSTVFDRLVDQVVPFKNFLELLSNSGLDSAYKPIYGGINAETSLPVSEETIVFEQDLEQEVRRSKDTDSERKRRPFHWGSAASSDLKDRALLMDWTYGFDDSQREKLSIYLDPNKHSPITENDDGDLSTPQVTFLKAALLTSRLLSESPYLRVLSLASKNVLDECTESFPSDVLLCTPGGMNLNNSQEFHWKTRRAEQTGLVLSIGAFKEIQSNLCIDFYIHELFPFPPEKYVTNATNKLILSLATSPRRLGLCIKHELARRMFAFNANRATIDFVCGDALNENGKQNIENESLTSYLHPNSHCIHEAYRSAIFHMAKNAYTQSLKYSGSESFNTIVITDDEACKHIPSEGLREIVNYMKTHFDLGPQSDPIEFHNQYVLYVVSLLVAGTGHRYTNSPFHFSFCFDMAEMMVFISDKNVVGSEARFVPITQMMMDQIVQFRIHIVWFVDYMRSIKKPDIAIQIEMASGIIKSRSNFSEQSSSTGCFFTVTNERLTPITSSMVDSHLLEMSSKMQFLTNIRDWTKALRRNLATFVAEFCPSGFHVEMLLGHNGEMHLFGPSSSWIPLEQYSVIRPLIDRYMKVNNWTIVNAHWVRKSHRVFDPVMPSFVQSSESYEGVSLSAEAARSRARQAIMSTLPVEETDDPYVTISIEEMHVIRRGLSLTVRSKPDESEMLLAEFDKLIGDWKVASGYEVSATTILTPLNLASAVQERMKTGGQSKELDAQGVLYEVCRAIEDIVGRDKLRKDDVLLLDDAEFRKIQQCIRQLLGSDHDACTKVLSEFNRLASKWRRDDRYRISSARVNLARYSEGAIPITFGRHLAIARYAERYAAKEIECYLVEDKTSVLRHLVALAVLLPLTEAVINIRELAPLLEAIQERHSDFVDVDAGSNPQTVEEKGKSSFSWAISQFRNSIEIRSTIESSTSLYDRTLDLTHIGASALVGYLRKEKSSESYSFKDIESGACELLHRIYGAEAGITYAKFVRVMQPYWFLRLPASIYASCVGQLGCNAPSESSTALLLGGEPPVLEIPVPKRRTSDLPLDIEILGAKKMAIELLRNSEGSVVNRNANSKLARQRLRKILGSNLSIDLLDLMNRIQAFDLWISFLIYMLVVGGKRKDKLAFGTLMNYQDRMLKHFLAMGWNKEILKFSGNEFSDFYAAIIDAVKPNQKRDVQTVLRLFHRFLRSDYAVPQCDLFPPERILKRSSRNVVIPFRHLNTSIEFLMQNTKNLRRSISVSAGALLAADCAWGLRPMEGFGLDDRNFGCVRNGGLKLRRNSTRSLKTIERTIPLSLSDEYRMGAISERTKMSNIKIGSNVYSLSAFMASPEDQSLLLEPRDVMAAANWAVKCSTGDPQAVSYSVRHLFGTSLMVHMTMQKPEYSPIVTHISSSLDLPESAKYALELIKPGLNIYPFQPDRIGMWMGHLGVGTLATTYWHCAWNVCGEYAQKDACKTRYSNAGSHHPVWNDTVLAALLNCSRTKVVEVRKLIAADIVEEKQYQAIVQHFVGALNITALSTISKTTEGQPASPVYISEVSFREADRLLVRWSMQTPQNLDVLIQAAHDEFGIIKDHARNFYDTYMNIANELVFADYQPSSISNSKSESVDLSRGALKRRDLLGKIAERFSFDTSFQERTSKAVSDWRLSVYSNKPFLVSYSIEQCLEHIDWLIEVGYMAANICVSHHGLTDSVKTIFLNRKTTLSTHAKQFGRIGYIGKEYEFGVSVDHSRTCPSGRELHRVLFALSICMDPSVLKN